MARLKKWIDPYLLMLAGLIGVWWLLSWGVETPASEIEELNRTSEPASWMDAIQSPSRAVRVYARENILEAVPNDSLGEMAVAACSDADKGSRLVGLWLLARIEVPGRGEMAAGFLDDEGADIREAALGVLTEDPVPEAHDVLVELTGDTDVSVQRTALAAVAALGDPDDLPLFIEFLGRQNPGIREIARDAVLGLALLVPDMVPRLLEVSHARNNTAATEALALLGEIGGSEALDGLFEFLGTGPPPLGINAAEAIGKIGGESAVDRALTAFRTGGSRARRVAARALGALGAKEAGNDLWAAARDPNEEFWLRHYALVALATCGDETLVADVIGYLEEGTHDPRIMRGAIESLGGMDGEQVIELYDSILAGEEDLGLNASGGETAQLSVLIGLGHMDNDASRDRLRTFLENAVDDQFALIMQAALSLGKVGTREDIERLREMERKLPILRAKVAEAVRAIEERFPEEGAAG